MGLRVISLFEIKASQFISTRNLLGVSHAHKVLPYNYLDQIIKKKKIPH